jgi:ATP-dependent Lon protease
MRAPILLFVGLVGTGKTTIAYSIAEAMGRQFARVPFGGMSDPLDLRGQSRARPDAEPGMIIKALRRAGTKNPVILFDEIDRITTEGLSSIMGVLVELLDPEQNMAFRDHFVDYPFDLSEVLFIATCNNTTNISVAVMDRMEPIQMPSYTDEEKITIGKDFVLPRLLEEAGLDKDAIVIEQSVWPKIVRPLGYDAGVRTLQRNINGVVRKVAREIVEGKGKRHKITSENMRDYLPAW